MVADKETPLEHTTIPSRENKKTQTGHTHFTLSQLRALPLHAQPGNGDFWRQNARKNAKIDEEDRMRRTSGALFRGEAQTRVLGSLRGRVAGEQKTKMTKTKSETTQQKKLHSKGI
jgi:hypothetical protein